MMRKSLIAAFVVLLTLSGCATNKSAQQSKASAKLQVIAKPTSASVYVDDEYFGSANTLSAFPKALSAGAHEITLRAAGFFPHDLQMDLQPGTTTIRASLRPIPAGTELTDQDKILVE